MCVFRHISGCKPYEIFLATPKHHATVQMASSNSHCGDTEIVSLMFLGTVVRSLISRQNIVQDKAMGSSYIEVEPRLFFQGLVAQFNAHRASALTAWRRFRGLKH